MFKICFQIIFSSCAPTHFSILLPHPSQLSSCLALVNPTQWLKPGMFPMCPTICSTPPQWPWPQYPLQPPQVLLLPRANPLSPAIMTNPGALEQQVAVQPIGHPPWYQNSISISKHSIDLTRIRKTSKISQCTTPLRGHIQEGRAGAEHTFWTGHSAPTPGEAKADFPLSCP